jgi:hypothetical protein
MHHKNLSQTDEPQGLIFAKNEFSFCLYKRGVAVFEQQARLLFADAALKHFWAEQAFFWQWRIVWSRI